MTNYFTHLCFLDGTTLPSDNVLHTDEWNNVVAYASDRLGAIYSTLTHDQKNRLECIYITGELSHIVFFWDKNENNQFVLRPTSYKKQPLKRQSDAIEAINRGRNQSSATTVFKNEFVQVITNGRSYSVALISDPHDDFTVNNKDTAMRYAFELTEGIIKTISENLERDKKSWLSARDQFELPF